MPNHLLYVVDDDAVILQVIGRVAQECGYNVRTFTTGPAFETAVADQEPDLIILDISIGAHDGVELLNFLARRRCAAPIMMVSGFDGRLIDSAVRVGRALDLTMLEPLSKPLKVPKLRDLLKAIGNTALPIRAHELERALAVSELAPWYQPKVRVADRSLAGTEALVRWNHPERGLLPPGDFLPQTEAGPHMTPLTFLMIERALADCVAWKQQGFDIPVAVNVSAHSLTTDGFADKVWEIVSRAGAAAENLTLEITETAAMADTAAILTVLTRLRIKGISLSLDDFGTGYSSLRELHRMPFTEIKVDRSFVTGMCRDRDAAVIVRAIVGLGVTLGLRTVAEGVESEEVMAALADIGCDVAQGFLIARPMPAADVSGWLRQDGVAEREVGLS